MVSVWLYSSDGRALYNVAVALPMPQIVSYAGKAFHWQGDRYIQIATPYYAREAKGEPEAKEEHYPK